MIYVQPIVTKPQSPCVPSVWTAVPSSAPQCPFRTFFYSWSSKSSRHSKCSTMKTILEKCLFLSQWKFLISVTQWTFELLGWGLSKVTLSPGGGNNADALSEWSLSRSAPISTAGTADVISAKTGGTTTGLNALFFVEGGDWEHLWAVATMLVGRNQRVKENAYIWHLY